MPELPEVQKTVDGLNTYTRGKKIIDIWTDLAIEKPKLAHHYHTIKSASFLKIFKSLVVGATIIRAERRAKNIFIHLSNDAVIWIHMKMTGHLLYGSYVFDTHTNIWTVSPLETNDALRDPFNRFIHLVFVLDNKKQLVLSDVRKFGKVTAFPKNKYQSVLTELALGPEPLEKTFTKKIFILQLQKQPEKKIKEVLLDQSIVSGIGNIYSDEALWRAAIHPCRIVKTLDNKECTALYRAVIYSLKKGIAFGGDSTSDYRDITGNPGAFQGSHEAYRRTGKPCRKKGCTGIITRISFGTRNGHFCPIHQK